MIGQESLDPADYAIYKNITRFTYIEAADIEFEKDKLQRDMRQLVKYFQTQEFQQFKKKYLLKMLKIIKYLKDHPSVLYMQMYI